MTGGKDVKKEGLDTEALAAAVAVALAKALPEALAIALPPLLEALQSGRAAAEKSTSTTGEAETVEKPPPPKPGLFGWNLTRQEGKPPKGCVHFRFEGTISGSANVKNMELTIDLPRLLLSAIPLSLRLAVKSMQVQLAALQGAKRGSVVDLFERFVERFNQAFSTEAKSKKK
jgi:hypothetical protein